MATMTFEIQSLNLCELSEITRGDGFGNVRQSLEATRMSLVIGQKPSGIFGQVRFGLRDFVILGSDKNIPNISQNINAFVFE